MPLIPRDNDLRFGRQSAFQNLLVAGVGGFAASAFRGKEEVSGFGQGLRPADAFVIGVFRSKSLHGLVVFR